MSLVVTNRANSASSHGLSTQEGDVLGTPSYMSPEQASGHVATVDMRSDVCGPDERYATMLELVDDLRAYLESRVVRAHRTGVWTEARKFIARHRAVSVVSTALLATLAAAGITFAVLCRQSELRRTRLQAAQLDSQRRINAMRGFAPSGKPAVSFFDDFDGDRLHRRWTVLERADLVSLRDGGLVLRSAGGVQSSTAVCLDPHVVVIDSDFDLRVRFRLIGFDPPGDPRGERIAAVLLQSLVTGRVVVAIQREAERDAPPNVPGPPSYRCYDERTVERMRPAHMLESDEREGRTRITRKDGEFAAYCWRDGWRELYRGPAQDEPAQIVFCARNWGELAARPALVARHEPRAPALETRVLADRAARPAAHVAAPRVITLAARPALDFRAGRADASTLAGLSARRTSRFTEKCSP